MAKRKLSKEKRKQILIRRIIRVVSELEEIGQEAQNLSEKRDFHGRLKPNCANIYPEQGRGFTGYYRDSNGQLYDISFYKREG